MIYNSLSFPIASRAYKHFPATFAILTAFDFNSSNSTSILSAVS